MKEIKEVLQDKTQEIETSESGYVILQNKRSGTWELLAPGGIHLETYRTKTDAEKGATKRETFNRKATS